LDGWIDKLIIHI